MNRAPRWTFESVGSDVREAAKDAALADGLTLGQWLKRAIEDHATGKGLDPFALDEHECAAAIMDRLSLVAVRQEPRPERRAAKKVDDMLQDLARRLGEGTNSTIPKTQSLRERATALQETRHSALQDALQEALRLTGGKTDPQARQEAPFETRPAPAMRVRSEKRFQDPTPQSVRTASPPTLRQQLDQLARNIPDPPPQEAAIDRDGRPNQKAARIETLERGAPSIQRERTQDYAALSHLNAKTDEIRDLMANVAERSANAPRIERQLDLLGARIDALAASAPTVAETNALMAGLAEIRTLFSQVPDLGRLDSVDRKLDQLSRRVEGLALAADPSPQFDDLVRRVDNVHRRIESNASLLAKVDTSGLQQLMQELTRKLEKPAPKIEIPALDFTPIESELRRLSNKVEAAAARTDNPVLEGLRRDIASLSTRVDAVSATVQSTAAVASQASAEQLEPLRKEVLGLATRMDAIAASATEVSVLDGLQTQIALLVDRIEALTRRDPPGVQALQAQIVHLAEKIDAISAPSREEEMLTQLQAEIARLTRQFGGAPAQTNSPAMAMLEQVQEHLERLPRRAGRAQTATTPEATIEDSISSLFQQIHDLRDATADAAGSNDPRAAQDAKAPQRPQAPLADDGLKRELSDLRTHQETADRRMTETMSAVHQTMELLVNRLTDLESELCEVRPEPVDPTEEARKEPSISLKVETRPQAKKEDAKERAPEARQQMRQELKVESERRQEPLLAPLPAAPQVEPNVPQGKETAAPTLRQAGPGAALSTQASFIAAARRAAIAASEAEPQRQSSPFENLMTKISGRASDIAAAEPQPQTNPKPEPQQAQGPLGALRKAIGARRRPLLIALAGLALILGTLQTLRSLQGGEKPAGSLAQADRKELALNAKTAAQPAPSEPSRAAAPSPAQAAAPAITPAKATEQPPATQQSIMAAPEKDATPGFVPPLAANGFDPTPTGATPAPAAAQNPSPATPPTSARLAEAANNGLPAAQYEIGVRLAEGRGMAQDNQAALQWFEKAASQNLAPAQYRLAAMLERGLGDAKDLKRAQDLYARAAAQGHVRAMHNLGVLSAEEADGKPDYSAAASWFRKAAEYGLRDSQYNLAVLNARGMGVEKNLPVAWAWFTAAAAQGDADSAQKRDEIAPRMTAPQMATAKALAEAYRPRTPDPMVNEAGAPPGGWDTLSVTNTPKPAAPASKAKVSKL